MFFDLGDIYLRELQTNDLDGNWYKWFNNEEVTRYQDKRIYPNTYEKQLKYYNYLLESNEDVVMAIIDKKTEIHIGNIGLHKINYIHRRSEIGIVIGEEKFQGKGYGGLCIEAFVKYAFDILNLNRLTAIVMEENISSLKIFEKAGFSREGIMKSYFYKNGKYLNSIIVGKLK